MTTEKWLACNPPLAHGELTAELDIGLLLPCNVIAHRAEDPNHSVVAALDPVVALSLTRNEAIQPLAEEVRVRLQQVLANISNAGRPAA
jgi:uncharacterized protein (DUF302 family)